jgi:hypothetical protein
VKICRILNLIYLIYFIFCRKEIEVAEKSLELVVTDIDGWKLAKVGGGEVGDEPLTTIGEK